MFGGRGGATGTRGPTGEQAQSTAADEAEPVKLRCHEQRGTQVTLPGHGERDPVERDRCVPEKKKMKKRLHINRRR